jgi:hypothetical protein
MGRVRRCDRRCHEAKGTRCRCWCGGFFHGAGGAANRADLKEGVRNLIYQPGFKEGETAYIEQKGLPLPVA